MPVLNAFSVDVEEHFQVLNFRRGITPDDWGSHESRVQANTERLLRILDASGTKATFFILGWLAERHPDLVRTIAGGGHEVASHGWSHTPLWDLDERRFREEVARTRHLLAELSGQEVVGFRAPSFSLGPRTPWAADVLLETGHRYDSSVFPIRHPEYGQPAAPPGIHALEGSDGARLMELPPSVARLLGRRLPVAGGGWFRLLPWWLTRLGLRRVVAAGRPVVFYIHPWEVDPQQPDLRQHTSNLGAFRHYVGLQRTEGRLERLLKTLPFGTCRAVLASAAGQLPTTRASSDGGSRRAAQPGRDVEA